MSISFDMEGHVLVAPDWLGENLQDPKRIVFSALLRGTPHAFPTLEQYRLFVQLLCSELYIHEANIVIRGSGHLGFSFSPKRYPSLFRRKPSPKNKRSDLDIAIVDPSFFERIDSEIRHWELLDEYLETVDIRENLKNLRLCRHDRMHNVYKSWRFPLTPTCKLLQERLSHIDTTLYCGDPHTLTAWVFRDWASITNRWLYDLKDLEKALEHAHAL